MGKIVKFCSSCDEGFAEKFGYCPNCGSALQAFEMNPLTPAAPPVAEPAPDLVAAAPVVSVSEPETSAAVATVIEPEIPAPVEVAAEPELSAAVEVEPAEESILEIREPEDTVPEVEAAPEPEFLAAAEPVEDVMSVEESVEDEDEAVEESVFVAPVSKAAAASADVYVQTTPVDVDAKPSATRFTPPADFDEFHVTVIVEKNVGQRRLLLLGALCFMLFTMMSGLVYNLFSKDLEVGSINDDIFSAVIVDDVPVVTDEEIKPKNKDDGGGGGGGGREEDETTQGDLANQTKNPERPPQAVPRLENPELTLPPASTQGNKTFEQKFDRFGDPNGRFASWNNGTGSGGGQGSGTGTGQGSGRGTGAGSGTGSGYGGGLGNGNGNGTGDGDGDGGPPPRVAGVTQGLKILSKPRPGYTDAARQNNIQGTVILRVTFLASGQIGSISPVKGLPNGLTEQAIAAARRISFEPAKTNGVGQSVTRQIEYSFSIY